jgi:hypothetical protein
MEVGVDKTSNEKLQALSNNELTASSRMEGKYVWSFIQAHFCNGEGG